MGLSLRQTGKRLGDGLYEQALMRNALTMMSSVIRLQSSTADAMDIALGYQGLPDASVRDYLSILGTSNTSASGHSLGHWVIFI